MAEEGFSKEVAVEEDVEDLDYTECIEKMHACRKNFEDYTVNMERQFQSLQQKMEEAFHVANRDFRHYLQSLEVAFEASERQCLQRLETMKKHQDHYGNMLHVLNEFREQSSMLERMK
ncbi:hypothetical protein EON64_06240 [archaeon]|nr:MAG: hypothetical protein EON64_06240 [archaeon]